MSQAIAVCHGEFGRAALYRLDKPIIIHAHREGHLIFHVEGEFAEVTCSGMPGVLDPTHAVAVSPWEPHAYDVAPGAANTCLVLYIKPMWFLENSVSARFAMHFGKSHLVVTPEIAVLVSHLTALLLDSEDQIEFDRLLFSLTRVCFDASWAEGEQGRQFRIGQRFNDYRVRRSLRLIQEGMADDLDMEHLARSVGLSRPHFFKLFKQCMGLTPNVYMNTLRSERAIHELLNSNQTVTDIAFDLGFASQASFTRFFSSNVGIAPSEYRRVAHVTGDPDASFRNRRFSDDAKPRQTIGYAGDSDGALA